MIPKSDGTVYDCEHCELFNPQKPCEPRETVEFKVFHTQEDRLAARRGLNRMRARVARDDLEDFAPITVLMWVLYVVVRVATFS
jgi:hypothetical protein